MLTPTLLLSTYDLKSNKVSTIPLILYLDTYETPQTGYSVYVLPQQTTTGGVIQESYMAAPTQYSSPMMIRTATNPGEGQVHIEPNDQEMVYHEQPQEYTHEYTHYSNLHNIQSANDRDQNSQSPHQIQMQYIEQPIATSTANMMSHHTPVTSSQDSPQDHSTVPVTSQPSASSPPTQPTAESPVVKTETENNSTPPPSGDNEN